MLVKDTFKNLSRTALCRLFVALRSLCEFDRPVLNSARHLDKLILTQSFRIVDILQCCTDVKSTIAFTLIGLSGIYLSCLPI